MSPYLSPIVSLFALADSALSRLVSPLVSLLKAHKTLMGSSDKGVPTLIGRRSPCASCTKQWCFSLREGHLKVETTGVCAGDKDVTRLKCFHSRAYAKDYTPARALKAMREAGVPPELRPDQVQLKNMRPKQGATRSGKSIACLGALRAFVSNPPKDVHCVCEDDRALIAFSLKELIDERMQGSNLECFLLDWTFKTNSHGLLLGSVGPVGLVMQKHRPGMRFLPTILSWPTARMSCRSTWQRSCI